MDVQETEAEKGSDSATNDEFTWKVPGPLAEFIDGRAQTASTIAMMATLFYSLDAADGESLIIDPGAIHLATLDRADNDPLPTTIVYREWLLAKRPTLFKALSRLKVERLNIGQKRVSANDPRRDPTQLPPIRLTDDLSGEIIPYALRLSKLTSNRNKLDLRHLLFAMAHYAPVTFPTLLAGFKILKSEQMGESDAAGLKTQIALNEVENPKSGDSIEAWRLLAELPLEEVEARFAQADVPPHPTRLPDATGYQLDAPSSLDHLNREGFANALADIIIDAHNANCATANTARLEGDPNHAFMIHLDGPWGSGKSTVLGFLRKRLAKDWLIVDINAWKMQRLEPPWWTIISQIQHAAVAQAQSRWQKWRLIRQSLLWRLKALGWPVLVGLVALMVIVGLGFRYVAQSGIEVAALAALVSPFIAFFGFSKSLIFGSNKAIQTFETLKSDPYRPVMDHFEELVRTIGRPVIVLIDDLDRCDAPTISAMIESIQTMLRGAPITYLVAADRKWLCTGFANRYQLFADHAPDAGKPLGYLFLEKIFQISVGLPVMSDSLRQGLWNHLLGAHSSLKPDVQNAEEAQAEAVEAVKDLKTQEQFEELLAGEEAGSPKDLALRSAIARQVASAEVQALTEHKLSQFPFLMERNPRGMKRLLSAVTMNRSRLFTEGRSLGLIEIARWTALELRWPLLAEAVAAMPALLDTPQTSPTGVLSLLATPAVRQVLGETGAEGQVTSAVVTRLVG